MANKNTNPVGGKTAVPADINNAQPAYFPKPHLGGATSPLPATPNPNRTNAKKDSFFSAPISHYSSLITHIPKYRNQISTLLGVCPLNFPTPDFLA